MIQLIGRVIRERLPVLIDSGFDFRFLKFSTPTSGSTLNDKIIFLVFMKNSEYPFLCVKTVRHYGAREVIVKNLHNLQKLNQLTENSEYYDMFAKAMYLYDDGQDIFSIESACIGDRLSFAKNNLDLAIECYTALQFYLKSKEAINNLELFGNNLIAECGFAGIERQRLVNYFESLILDRKLSLPKIIQHGDFTMDNILFSKGKIRVIDYDYVGVSDLPGFDLFSLLFRYSQERFGKIYKEYFSGYFEKIGINARNYDGLIFLFYLTELLKKRGALGNTAEEIINRFKKLLF